MALRIIVQPGEHTVRYTNPEQLHPDTMTSADVVLDALSLSVNERVVADSPEVEIPVSYNPVGALSADARACDFLWMTAVTVASDTDNSSYELSLVMDALREGLSYDADRRRRLAQATRCMIEVARVTGEQSTLVEM